MGRRPSHPLPEGGAAANAIQIINAREHNLKHLNVDIPRGRFNVITGVSGSGKVHAGVSTFCSARASAAIGKPERLRVASSSPRAGRGGRRLWHTAHRGDRAAPVARRQEEHRGHDHRGLALLRLLYVKLGVQHCVHDGAAVQPQTSEHRRAAAHAVPRPAHRVCWRPWVLNRKGVYTELADWARPRGYTHLRVDGNFLPTTGFPRLDRFKEHTIELPVASLDVSPEPRRRPAQPYALSKALELGKGVLHVLSGLDGLEQAMEEGAPTAPSAGCRCSPPSAPARSAPPAMPSWIRACSRTTANMAGAGLRGHGRAPDERAAPRRLCSPDDRGREQTFAEPRWKTWPTPPAPLRRRA